MSYIRRFSSPSDSKSDKELQDSFGTIAKINVFLSAYFKGESNDPKIQSFLNAKIAPHWLEAFQLYCLLKNPLLTKYDFDVFDFFDGAKVSPKCFIFMCFYHVDNSLKLL